VPAIFFLGVWFVMQFLSGVGSGATATEESRRAASAFWAHVAGFAAGVVGVFVFKAARTPAGGVVDRRASINSGSGIRIQDSGLAQFSSHYRLRSHRGDYTSHRGGRSHVDCQQM
jgi:hypothetical protein